MSGHKPVLSVYVAWAAPRAGHHRQAGALRVLGERRYVGLSETYLCRLADGTETYLPCAEVTLADNLVVFPRRSLLSEARA